MPTPSPTTIAKRFERRADGLPDKIADKRRPMTQNPTPKRNRDYQSRLWEADCMEREQMALETLAALWYADNVPDSLRDVVKCDDVAGLVRLKLDTSGGHYSVRWDLNTYARDTEAAVELQSLIADDVAELLGGERTTTHELDKAEAELVGVRIPGFFPTPDDVADRLIGYARIGSGDQVLEPSAGSGALVDALRRDGVDLNRITTVEPSHVLRKILTLKNCTAVSDRIEDLAPDFTFDRIVMNPPFENGTDAAHVRLAYDRLRPGGRLVAIMAPGPFFNKARKFVEFREWFTSVGGNVIEDLDGGWAKSSGTMVNAKIVEIDKPEATTSEALTMPPRHVQRRLAIENAKTNAAHSNGKSNGVTTTSTTTTKDGERRKLREACTSDIIDAGGISRATLDSVRQWATSHPDIKNDNAAIGSVIVEAMARVDARRGDLAIPTTTAKGFHTKRRCDVWTVTTASRVDRATFDSLKAHAKTLDGWYSRKWKDNPGGFMFDNEAAATTFADDCKTGKAVNS